MKRIKSKKKTVFLLIIFLLAAFLRFYNLGQMPYGVTNDEAGYIYNAYSIAQTSKDANGRFLPFSISLDNPFSPVPIYLNAIVLKLIGLSVFKGRFLYACLGVGSVLLIFLLAKQLFKNHKIALASSFVLAISPWHLHISRSAYESGVALFFYLLAMLVFFKKTKTGRIFWSLPFFFLAYYSYHATKIFFIPFVLILVLSQKKILIRRKWSLVAFIFGALLIFSSFLIIGRGEGGLARGLGKEGVLLFKDVETAAKVVNLEREKNIAPFFIRSIFNNKGLYFLRIMRENYLSAFSPHFLFLYGEPSALGGIYGTWFRGVMYIIELPLLIIGLIFLCQKFKDKRNIILLSLLVAPLATTFTKDLSYVMRAVMMLPFLTLLVGLGLFRLISTIYMKYKNLNFRRLIITGFVIWYLFLLIGYFYQYHYRYSVYGAEYWFRSSHDLADLLKEYRDDYDEIQVVHPGPMFIFQYGIFSNLDPTKVQAVWQSEMPQKIDNVVFIKSCIDSQAHPDDFLEPKVLYIVPDECHREAAPFRSINEFGESARVIWKVYTGKI